MPKLITTRHDFRQNSVLDLFICGGRQRPIPDSETIPVAELPYGTKRSRQAVDGANRLSMKRHGGKQTGTKTALWAFEHRWPHRRDHAEGRNHRLPTK